MTPSKKTILMVDDDPDYVEAVSSFLEANGYVVLKAHDGRDGGPVSAHQEEEDQGEHGQVLGQYAGRVSRQSLTAT